MENYELLDYLKDKEEKINITNELIRINEYKIYILRNNSSREEIRNFIVGIINKYRKEIIVRDYYNSVGEDKILINDYDNLCLIEKMIKDYIIRKTKKDSIQNNI